MSHSQDNIPEVAAGFTDLKGVELEEENIHLNAENLELRQKMKQLSEKNNLLQLRVVELNDLIKDLSESSSSPSHLGGDTPQLLKQAREENDQLRRQLSSQRHRYQALVKRAGLEHEIDEDEEEFDQNSFLEGI